MSIIDMYKKYNNLLFVSALLVLSLVAGFVGYSRYTQKQKEKAEFEMAAFGLTFFFMEIPIP